MDKLKAVIKEYRRWPALGIYIERIETHNESWNDSFGEFAMGDYSYPASEILFNVDKQAYVNEYKAFTEAEV